MNDKTTWEEYLCKVFDSALGGEDFRDISYEESMRLFKESYPNPTEPYEFPSIEELADYHNGDLWIEVLNWITSRITDWDNEFQDLQKHPKPCQWVFACYTAVNEIGNGGFNQLFFNLKQSYGDNMPEFIGLAIDGFIEMREPQFGDMIKKALEIYPQNYDELENEAMSNILEQVTNSIANYVRLHVDCFSDKNKSGENPCE